MIALLLAFTMAADTAKPKDRMLSEDKFKHAGMSFAITSFSYAATENKAAAVSAAVTAGLLKELYDRRHKRPFSVKDLMWDAAGIALGYVMIKQVK
jgi:uncharacterized protein YfiM (DUF2279 family)